jgi:hypothetical protein
MVALQDTGKLPSVLGIIAWVPPFSDPLEAIRLQPGTDFWWYSLVQPIVEILQRAHLCWFWSRLSK